MSLMQHACFMSALYITPSLPLVSRKLLKIICRTWKTRLLFYTGITISMLVVVTTLWKFKLYPAGPHYLKGNTNTTIFTDAHRPREKLYHNSTQFGSKDPVDSITIITRFNGSFTDLLPRSAYFDSRPRDGHDNATVILVQVSKRALKDKQVIGCGVDNHFTLIDFKFKELYIFSYLIHRYFPSLTHDEAVLTCYDLPAHNGSRVFVIFKHNTTEIVKIESERRLFIPSRTLPKKEKFIGIVKQKSSIVVCTTLYSTPTWFREWLVYQKTIGVDFIHLYAQESFIAEGGESNPVLQSYLKNGYARLDVWKAYLNESQDYYHQQALLYMDCIYRYLTQFDYAVLYDTDDFFVPREAGEADIHFYANRIFQNKKVGSALFRWITFYPDCGLTRKPKDIKDGNVTKYVAFEEHQAREESKSMHRLLGVVETEIHHSNKLMPNYIFTHPDPHFAYVAHVRMNRKPKKKELLHKCENLSHNLSFVHDF